MKSLVVCGLLCNILGAFLLGIEAIKLENIQKFKKRILEPLHSHSQSPRLFFSGYDEANERAAALGPRKSENWPPGLYQALHWVAGFLVLALAHELSNGWFLEVYGRYGAWVLNLSWYFAAPLGLWSLLVSVVSVWGLGEMVHIGITSALSASIRIAEFILSETEAGVTGLYGLLLLVLGFSMQALGTLMK